MAHDLALQIHDLSRAPSHTLYLLLTALHDDFEESTRVMLELRYQEGHVLVVDYGMGSASVNCAWFGKRHEGDACCPPTFRVCQAELVNFIEWLEGTIQWGTLPKRLRLQLTNGELFRFPASPVGGMMLVGLDASSCLLRSLYLNTGDRNNIRKHIVGYIQVGFMYRGHQQVDLPVRHGFNI